MKVPQMPSMWMCTGRRARQDRLKGAGPKKGNNSSVLRCVFRLRYHGATPACFSMPKESKLKQQQMRMRIAAAAARLMAEDGLEDFALAKRKAARQLGAEDTQALPKNEEIEAELRAYQSLYQGEEQRERIHYLRERALEAMRLLERFRPYLAGAVLKGTAGRYSDIDLQLFTDDGKAVELFLLNRNIDIVRIFDVNYVDLAWLPCGPLNAQPSHPSPVKSLALARPPFYPYEFPHSCSNCAEYWTISDIGRKLPLCPSQNAHWAHARGHQEEYWSFTAPISTCWVPVSLDSTERNPSRASTRNSVESPSARGLPWKRFKATTRER